jgi:hypothetical protein
VAALTAAQKPRFGGEIVEELITLKTKSEPRYTYRLSDGYVLEMCSHGCYVGKLGRLANTFLVDIDLIERVGAETPDTYAITKQTQTDTARFLTDADVDLVFDDVFAHLVPLYSLTPANMNSVGDSK